MSDRSISNMTMDMNLHTSVTHTHTTKRPSNVSPSPTSTPSYSPNLPTSTLPNRNIKRSFDVAFLMAPDEKFAKKQQEKLRLVATGTLLKKTPDHHSNNITINHQFDLDRQYQDHSYGLTMDDNEMPKNYSQKNTTPNKSVNHYPTEMNLSKYDDVFLERCKQIPQNFKQHHNHLLKTFEEADRFTRNGFKSIEMHLNGQRSAFTKVTSNKFEIPISPRSVSSLSPDHVDYQGSMSPLGNQHPSPQPHYQSKQLSNPMPMLSPHVNQNGVINQLGRALNTSQCSPFILQSESGGKHIKNGNHTETTLNVSESYRNSLTANGNFRSIDSYLLKAATSNSQFYTNPSNEKDVHGFMNTNVNKMRSNMLYNHPEAVAYSTLAAAYPFATNFQHPNSEMLRPSLANPVVAAAVSASLLPSSFAAFSLPAQNVCAKCNISFRMTSDLVYHMRSHHKGDHISADPMRRRREHDKLKCPVCSESFRERHHLTRHMTAHQDKAGDAADNEDDGEVVDHGRKRFSNMAAGQAAGK